MVKSVLMGQECNTLHIFTAHAKLFQQKDCRQTAQELLKMRFKVNLSLKMLVGFHLLGSEKKINDFKFLRIEESCH